MTAPAALLTALLLLFSALGVVLGWMGRDLWLQLEARRFARKFRRTMDAIDRRERLARLEHRETWHIDAESDAEAWALFHRRTLLGVEGQG